MELLVVIAIIAILAGILLPVLSGVKTKAKIAQTRIEMANLETAIKQYESEYLRPPAHKDAEIASATRRPDYPDATYGTANLTGYPNVLTGVSGPAEGNNSVIMSILMDKEFQHNIGHARNPKKIPLWHSKEVDSPKPGVWSTGQNPDFVMRDPWGNPYIISIDLNDDDVTWDGLYRGVPDGDRVGLQLNTTVTPNVWELKRPVMIWSFGPDGQADRSVRVKEGVNKDNVLSWQQ